MKEIMTLFIVGPTASGKSALSIEIAKRYGAEIICADSQTLRRGMNIGTAKPSLEERSEVIHHMVDCIDPYDEFNLSLFLEESRKILLNIHSRGKKAIIVGGTGLYTDALYYNFQLPGVRPVDLIGRSIHELQNIIQDMGIEMPKNLNNPRHLINAIKRSGVQGSKGEPMDGSLIIGIHPGHDVLIERINARVEKMFDDGFIDEVNSLIDQYGEPPFEFDAIGYRIAHRYLRDEISLVEAKELFKIADRQYAKRQLSWYRRNQDIEWFSSPDEAKTFILSKV